jgi:23S rRNA (cytidine1920-2'-O)/16S rRNA (cytidine1409-2'-O)-methyltransferase
MVARELVTTRSQAESYIRLGVVKVDGKVQTKPGYFVNEESKVGLHSDQYVSRAGLKLASVALVLKLDFKSKVVLDVGSSTGGFTDYALQHGAKKVVAVDVGTNQLHPKLRNDKRIELHEQTDIRAIDYLSEMPDIIVIDVSFISLREILPHLALLSTKQTQIVAMFKPQFEVYAELNRSAGDKPYPSTGSGFRKMLNKGVIKNDKMRRDILKDFETWSKKLFVIKNKADSNVHGEKGNLERFYLLKVL